MKQPKSRFFLLTLVLVLTLAPAAFGQYLTELGPIQLATEVLDTNGQVTGYTGGHGFPQYIGDINGTKLDLAVVLDPVIPGNLFSEHTGFGAEGFYFLASADMPIRGGRARLDLGVEAAYGAEEPRNGDQFLFVRTRIRIDTPVTGEYTVYHPWGVEKFNVANVADGINFTYDWGGFGPLPECGSQTACLPNSEAPGFERILVSPKQGPFLVASGFENNPNCIGDGNPATVTGSAITHSTLGLQNFFRIEGPPGSNLDNAGQDFIQTDQFSVFGHKVDGDPNVVCGAVIPPPEQTMDTVIVTRARKNKKNRSLEVRATSDNPAAILTATETSTGYVYGTGQNGSLNLKVSVPAENPNPQSVTVKSSQGGSHTEPVVTK